MNARSVKLLAVVVIVLFGVLFALNSGERGTAPPGSNLLFPELKSRLNDLNELTVTDAEGRVTLGRSGGEPEGRWVSRDHGGYPADHAKLRELLLALADARKLEQKTSDPELYDRLGVEDPRQNGGDAVLVEARGDNAAVSIILGDVAQGEYRYARIPEEAQSWLIDRNPSIPDSKGGWLMPEIVDIPASRIESVTLRHADGEAVSIRKRDADTENFEVGNIPAGRDLRYPSIANSIATVVSGLVLEDVQTAGKPGDEPVATAAYRTFDGLQLEIAVHTQAAEDDGVEGADAPDASYWITMAASAAPVSEPAEAPSPAGDAGETGGTESADADAENPEREASGEPSPQEQAAEINERVAGWSYKISPYKGDQLTRRQDDLLSEPNADQGQ